MNASSFARGFKCLDLMANVCCQSKFKFARFEWEMNSRVLFSASYRFSLPVKAKLIVGYLVSLAMEKDFEIKLDSFESYCHLSLGVTLLLMSEYQLSLWNGSPSKSLSSSPKKSP